MGGKRYETTYKKINVKKVILAVFALIIIVMCISFGIKELKSKAKNSSKTDARQIANSYETIFSDGKWGVINSSGNIVIKPTLDNMIIIPDKTKPIFICQKNVDLENGKFTSYAIDDKQNNIFKDYDSVEAIQNIDKSNQIWYEENVLKVCKDGKYGLINFEGKVLLEPTYNSIEPIKTIKNSMIVTNDDGKVGLIDDSGNVIINPEYDKITNLTDKYEDGYIVTKNGKVGLINYNKKQVLDIKYDQILLCGSNMYVVKIGTNINLVDENGNELLTNKFLDAKEIANDKIVYVQNNKCGLMDKKGNILVNPDYDDLKYCFDSKYIAKKDGKAGIIDENGNTLVDFKYDSINYLSEAGIIEAENEDLTTDILDQDFSVKLNGIVSEVNSENGYIKIRTDGTYKYYNFKFEEKTPKDIYPANTLFLKKSDENGKYGFVDKNGETVVDYIYDDGVEQNEYGYAAVKKDGIWQAVNYKGELVQDSQNVLKNNTIISYIGKYHLAVDTNANYYTDTKE